MQHDHIDQHHHHNHDLSTVHYDSSTHDDYPRHHHEWLGNNHFDTVTDNDDVYVFDHHGRIVHVHRPDDDLIGCGGFDVRWADNHPRTTTAGAP